MRLHRAVMWLLRAHHIRDYVTRCSEIPVTSFQRHWVSGPLGSYGVMTIRIELTSLIEEIELWLRKQVEKELRCLSGTAWWTRLPMKIQQRAAYRYKLAVAEFGRKRAGSPHSSDWLSFGDLARILEGLSSDSWLRCLEALAFRRRAFMAALSKIKAFRDTRIAHCQSGGPTPVEVVRTLRRIENLCELLHPQDYIRSEAACALLKTIRGRGRRLLFDLYEPSGRMRPVQRRIRTRRLRDVLLSSSSYESIRPTDLDYYDAFIICCQDAGGTISPYVGDA
jgi:hypothetical protein